MQKTSEAAHSGFHVLLEILTNVFMLRQNVVLHLPGVRTAVNSLVVLLS